AARLDAHAAQPDARGNRARVHPLGPPERRRQQIARRGSARHRSVDALSEVVAVRGGGGVSVSGAAAISPAATERSTGFLLERLLPWLACIVVFAVGALAIDGQPVGVLRDDSMYVELAKSI